MSEQKSISKIVEEVAEEICDKYCKWQKIYMARYKDPDEAIDKLGDERCESCPLNRLI